MKNTVLACLILCVSIFPILIGCSSPNNNPIAPSDDEIALAGHESWGAYDMLIDPENGQIEVIPNRELMYHFNINGYMSLCPGGCFTFRIISIVGTVVEIEMTLKNPVKLIGHDVRIIFTHLNGKTVLNPDSYTDLFDPPSTPETINPFIAFRKEDPSRMFPATPSLDTEKLVIDFPATSLAATSWIIDASYPSNCGEPYEINNMNYFGNLNPTGGNGTITCDVLDHQDNVTAVTVNTLELTGGWSTMSRTVGNTWEVDITNSVNAPAGEYLCLIKAQSSDPSNASTYNYVKVIVNESTGEACDGAMNFFVVSDGNWIVDGYVENYHNGMLLKNLLNYTPTGPAANYHTFYYWGGKGGSFRNGNTTQAQAIAEASGYTFRKQETGNLDLSDVRIMYWPALGHGTITDPPTDDEINAMKNLLAQGGRIIISFEYDIYSDPPQTFINNQFQRLGTSIRKLWGGTSLNYAYHPEECEAFSHDIDTVMFPAYGFIEAPEPPTVTLFFSNLDEKIMVGEIL